MPYNMFEKEEFMKTTSEALEFGRIQAAIKQYTHSEVAKNYIEHLAMFSHREELQDALATLKEMIETMVRFSSWPLNSSFDLFPIITNGKKGGILTPLDIDHVATDIGQCNDIKRFFGKLDRDYPFLKEIVADFFDLTPLQKEIHRVIAPNLTIYDEASAALKSIRQRMRRQEQKINEKVNRLAGLYSSFLSDNLLTIRDGHYVLPVKTSEKNKVNGIIHDISDSGQTTFIEPNEIVVLNNEMVALKNNELEEIRRILRALTMLIISEEDHLLANNKLIGLIDFYSAKAKYALEINATIADVNTQSTIKIKSARHPLLDQNKVVANDFSFTMEERIVIISGPNAGGKTVALKTVGLLILMHHAGLAIPADEGANICFIKNIYVDIGDSQSISDNLSTFSGHIANLVSITSEAKSNDLILIDELGTGTDPDEGAALAEAVVKFLLEKNVFAMISSHYSGLKIMAINTEGLINASMIFDEHKLEPTYRMSLGVPGSSYGVMVAKRLGLNTRIIDTAKFILNNQGTSDIALTIQNLEQSSRDVLQKQTILDKKLKDIGLIEQQIESEKEELNRRKKNFLEDVNDEKAMLIDEALKKANAILATLEGAKKPHEVIAAKKELTDLLDAEPDFKSKDIIHENDFVLVTGLGILGRVTRIQGNHARIRAINGLSISADVDKLVHAEVPKKKKNNPVTNHDSVIVQGKVGLECNVIGFHVDEALAEVSRFLDGCRVKHYKEVRIIHGDGSGALRRAVHEYLKNQSWIKDFRLGGPGEGGLGATMVTLK